MSTPIHFAAHVDHPIAHTSNIARLSLGIGAAVLAAVIIVGTGGTAAILTFAAVGTVAASGSAGIFAGGAIDYFAPTENRCQIKSGIPSVLLGPRVKQAARADHDDSKVKGDHDGKKLAEGSKIVMLGRETKPMCRVGDRAEDDCGGKIADGLRSLLVGGVPSRHGQRISEGNSPALNALTMVFDIAGGVSGIAKGGAANIARGSVDIAGAVIGGDTQAALGLATITKPQNALDAVGLGSKAWSAGTSARDFITP
jgi:hypothetical protein